MEIIWQLLLTVCLGSNCLEQDIQWFESRALCEDTLIQYAVIPPDGDWESIEYICKPLGSKST